MPCLLFPNDIDVFSATKVEKLQDFLSQLFDPPTEAKPMPMPQLPPLNGNELQQRYEDIMEIVDRQGLLFGISATS